MGRRQGIGWKRIVVLTILATGFGMTMDYLGVIDWLANAI